MSSELKKALIELCSDLIREQGLMHDAVVENAMQIKIDAVRSAISMSDAYADQVVPRRTLSNPPTRKNGKRVLAWNSKTMEWNKLLVALVMWNPGRYPYWLPMPPPPGMDER